jgi:hypothetical protein
LGSRSKRRTVEEVASKGHALLIYFDHVKNNTGLGRFCELLGKLMSRNIISYIYNQIMSTLVQINAKKAQINVAENLDLQVNQENLGQTIIAMFSCLGNGIEGGDLTGEANVGFGFSAQKNIRGGIDWSCTRIRRCEGCPI